MGRHTSKTAVRHAAPTTRVRGFDEASDESWPVEDETLRALDDPDTGVDASSYERWRRSRSEPPPPLAHYRRRTD